MNPYNGICCETCVENDRLARTTVAVNELCEPLEASKEKEKEKGKEKGKGKGKEKRTRLPDKFNHYGKTRVSRQDKHLETKNVTANKKKDRSQLRRIKFGFDEPNDVRIGEGLTVHDAFATYSWKAVFGVRALSKLERENALRKSGHRLYTYGCACLRQAWKKNHPNLVAGTSFRGDKCPGCENPVVQRKTVQQILERYEDDFAHDDAFYLIV